MQLGAQLKTMPALAALQANAFEPAHVRQFANGDLKNFGCFVEYQSFTLRGKSARRQWKCGSTSRRRGG
jgi:hypothetical protein